eukprot:144079-Chlamydomonas_euryale.AAC.1
MGPVRASLGMGGSVAWQKGYGWECGMAEGGWRPLAGLHVFQPGFACPVQMAGKHTVIVKQLWALSKRPGLCPCPFCHTAGGVGMGGVRTSHWAG